MTTVQRTGTLADKLRGNIERQRIERAEQQRRAAEEAAQQRIVQFTANLENLKQDFIGMVDTGNATLEVNFDECHALHEEVRLFKIRDSEDGRRIEWVTDPEEPSLQPAWEEFKKWVTEQGLVLVFKRNIAHYMDAVECDFDLRLELPQS